MRKLLVLGLAALLVGVFTLPAAAVDHQFGGYWRTRAIWQEDFDGESLDSDLMQVDTRTRLYYTAILNENLKFVNKFEFDTAWGENNVNSTGTDIDSGRVAGNSNSRNWGDMGADGRNVEIKESYADFNWGPTQWKVGVHESLIARGFIFADEFAGLTVAYKAEGMTLIGEWMKIFEGGVGDDFNDYDFDIYGLNPVFTFGEGISINPFFYWAYNDSGQIAATATNPNPALPSNTFTYGENQLPVGGLAYDEQSIYWLGVNADFPLGPVTIWATGIYQGGSIDNDDAVNPAGEDVDIKAYLLAAGASMKLGGVDLRGQAFWASGDDDADDDWEAFFGIGGGGVGWAYYWAEIMGLGIYDNRTSAGSPGGDVSNLWAANIGATIRPIEKLSLAADLWYAQLVEKETGPGQEDDLGVEIDLVATYQLIEGLNLDVFGAYLFAGDATSQTGNNKDDPYEIGTRLSLSF